MAKRKKRKRSYRREEYYSLSPEAKRGIIIIILFALSILSILSFLSLAGVVGGYIDFALGMAFGWGRYLLPLLLIAVGYVLARPSSYEINIVNYIGVLLLAISTQGLLHLRFSQVDSFDFAYNGIGGGLIGFGVNYFLMMYLGMIATLIILLALFVTSIVLAFNTGIERIIERINIFKLIPFGNKNNDDDDEEEEDEDDDEEEEDEYEEDETEEQSKLETVRALPKELLKREPTSYKTSKIKIDLPLSLLDQTISKPMSGDINAGVAKIQHTLENFNIPVEMGGVKVGPTVTQYTFKPAEGIKLSKITSLNNDLALALAAHPIRIEAPIPGKSLVGIEVPNQKPAIVRVRETFESKDFKKSKSNLQLALGKDVSGKCWSDDLTKMPHLLVAGATGAGKSVCLNSIILSLLYRNNPDTLRLILVDPKRVEFPIYNGIPHLMTPVITDVTKTVYALRWAITEMDNRFDILSKRNKRDITSYNATSKTKLPHLVIIIDELADLMVSAAAEVETSIIRLTQMARAVGIHLIVATQRPSVDVITGLIKANIPARIAFSVASLMDSRTILDSSGAEKLVGKGDMLFMTPATSTPRRLQGNFVSDEEIKRVVEFLKGAMDEEPTYNEEVISKPSGSTSFDFKGGGNSVDDDELFDEARECVIQAGKASASYLQRKLRIGYARAARLIDLLEDSGIIGPGAGAKPREILTQETPVYTAPETRVNPDNDYDNDDDSEDTESEEDDDEKFDDSDDEETDDNNEEFDDDSDEDELDDTDIKEEEEEFDDDDDDDEIVEEPDKKRKGDEDEIY